MTRADALKSARALKSLRPNDAFAAALPLLRADHAEILQPAARELARFYPADPRMQQLLGLAARAAQDSGTAHAAFARAAALDPANPLIAHSHARAALEAGSPSVPLFERAARLAPQDGTVLQGLAAALLHDRSAQAAIDFLAQTLFANPLWLDGHRDAARLLGQADADPQQTVSAALEIFPEAPDLHLLRLSIALEARDLDLADEAGKTALSHVGNNRRLLLLRAHIASERGEMARAETLFTGLDTAGDIESASLYARHLLRAEQPEAASALLEPLVDADSDQLLWPYLSLAWRMTDDPRSAWLDGDPELVGVYDLSERLPDFAGLVEHVRSLHFADREPLDQSVRGGTQTDGNLLLRAEPPIAALRAVLLDTVASHVAQLPPARAQHPTLLRDRHPLRVAGSWSVRLSGAGFHADHVHSRGWLSSAFYLALPDEMISPAPQVNSSHAGWLSLGECRDVVPSLDPLRLVQPRIGRLVLFPSSMWHGTRPFDSGERMTVAFDIARPVQDTIGNPE